MKTVINWISIEDIDNLPELGVEVFVATSEHTYFAERAARPISEKIKGGGWKKTDKTVIEWGSFGEYFWQKTEGVLFWAESPKGPQM